MDGHERQGQALLGDERVWLMDALGVSNEQARLAVQEVGLYVLGVSEGGLAVLRVGRHVLMGTNEAGAHFQAVGDAGREALEAIRARLIEQGYSPSDVR
ncbi:hypothetical protein [Micromonospora sp. NPDC047730]|uniref:hypothetical protein n=1 Tax=Micromonospora sp. NPDC047730 TaxID=3364253 RepID=UPI003713ED52